MRTLIVYTVEVQPGMLAGFFVVRRMAYRSPTYLTIGQSQRPKRFRTEKEALAAIATEQRADRAAGTRIGVRVVHRVHR